MKFTQVRRMVCLEHTPKRSREKYTRMTPPPIPVLPANVSLLSLPVLLFFRKGLGSRVWTPQPASSAHSSPPLAAPGHSQVYACTRQLVVHPRENGPEEEATTDNGSRLSTARAGILGSWVPGPWSTSGELSSEMACLLGPVDSPPCGGGHTIRETERSKEEHWLGLSKTLSSIPFWITYKRCESCQHPAREHDVTVWGGVLFPAYQRNCSLWALLWRKTD